jgi:hypothetical protein
MEGESKGGAEPDFCTHQTKKRRRVKTPSPNKKNLTDSDTDTAHSVSDDDEQTHSTRPKHEAKHEHDGDLLTVIGIGDGLHRVHPRKITAAILSVVKPKGFYRSASGDKFTVKVSTQKDVLQLKEVKTIEKVTIKYYTPETKKRQPTGAQGIIHNVEQDITHEEIMQEAGDILTSCRRLGTSGSVHLVFKAPQMPEVFYLYYRAFRVKQYVPGPTRCYRCQRFGHTSRHCRREDRCGNCSGAHPTTECTEENQHCPNCEGPHKASSQECPKFLEVKNTQMLKRSYAAAATGASAQPTAAKRDTRPVQQPQQQRQNPPPPPPQEAQPESALQENAPNTESSANPTEEECVPGACIEDIGGIQAVKVFVGFAAAALSLPGTYDEIAEFLCAIARFSLGCRFAVEEMKRMLSQAVNIFSFTNKGFTN